MDGAAVRTRYLELRGGQLAYDDTGGDGGAVVCAPPEGNSRAHYRLLRPLLVDAGYRVVTMDLRGHGESSVNWEDYSPVALGGDLVALVDHLGIASPVVVGESVAAAAAVWAAAEAPARIAGLVLSGPFTRDLPTTFSQRLGMRLAGRVRPLWLAYWASLYRTHRPADFADYRRVMAASLREPGRLAALRAMFTASRAPCEARMHEVRCAVLIVMGIKDPNFPEPAAEAANVAERLSGRVVMIAGAGHYPVAEFPQATVDAVLPFLSQVFGET